MHRPRLIGRCLVVALTGALALTGCGGVSPGGGDAAGGASNADDRIARTVAIYSAVVRQLVTKDHTFGQAKSPFKRVFVLDGVVEGAGDPMKSDGEVVSPFPPEVKAGIEDELSDLPPLEFVSRRDEVIVDASDCPTVKENGVLISLGRIEGDAERVEVPNGLFFACLGGQWLTYVVERSGDAWKVTGTTGPVAIS